MFDFFIVPIVALIIAGLAGAVVQAALWNYNSLSDGEGNSYAHYANKPCR